MAVNTTEIGTVYNVLEGKMLGTLENLFNAYEIDATQKATVIAQGLTTILNLSVQSVQQQPLTDAQVSASSAQSSAITAQSTADTALKAKQGELIDKQKDTEVEKKLLTTRQKTGYDDQLRIKEAEMLANIAGMMGAGGATFSSADSGGVTFLSTMYSKIDAITP